jgi:hypothetical protein
MEHTFVVLHMVVESASMLVRYPYFYMAMTPEQFLNAANNPRAWMQTGDDLLKTAFLIYDTKLVRDRQESKARRSAENSADRALRQ